MYLIEKNIWVIFDKYLSSGLLLLKLSFIVQNDTKIIYFIFDQFWKKEIEYKQKND